MHDENMDDMHQLLTGDLHAALPQRVVVVAAISYFAQLLHANPLAASSNTLAGLAAGQHAFMHGASYLLQPAPGVRDVVERYYLEHMAGRHIVAVHLRTIEYMSPLELLTGLHPLLAHPRLSHNVLYLSPPPHSVVVSVVASLPDLLFVVILPTFPPTLFRIPFLAFSPLLSPCSLLIAPHSLTHSRYLTAHYICPPLSRPFP